MPMANTVLFDALVEIDGIDRSNQVRRLTVPGGRVMRQDNAMGDEMEKMASGPKNGQLSITLRQGFLYNGVHAQLQALLDAGAPFTVKVRPRKALPAGPDNPTGIGSFIIENYTPLDAAWGELTDAVCTFRNAEGADFAWTDNTSV